MGGSDSKDNLVLLTAREHYLAHVLLAKHYKTRDLYLAVHMMASTRQEKRKLTSRQIERARVFHSLGNYPNLGKKFSKEVREKMSKAQLGKTHSEETKSEMSRRQLGENNSFYGRHHSEETRRKISSQISGENHPNYGKKHSKETKRKMSEGRLRNKTNIYKFQNIKTKEIVETTCYDLEKNYDCQRPSRLVNGTRKFSKGWILYS